MFCLVYISLIVISSREHGAREIVRRPDMNLKI
jgi:hypothetical protein